MFTVVTVISAFPFAFPTIKPSSTVATLVSLLVHVTLLYVALLGNTFAVIVWLPPTFKLTLVFDNSISVSSTIFDGLFTFTFIVSVYPPSFVVNVITAFPSFTAVILCPLTLTTFVSLLVIVTP